MATAGENDYELECAICTEILRDTRMLQCGHCFCKLCLETIAEDHPQGSVTCCKCDYVTDTNGKAGIDKLREVKYITDLADIKRVEVTRQRLIDQQDKVADTELVCGEKDILQYNTGTILSKYTTEDTRQNELTQTIDTNIDTQTVTTPVDKQSPADTPSTPLKHFVKITSFEVGRSIYGLAVDSVRGRLALRGQDMTAPITVYDLKRNQLREMGEWVKGIADGYNKGIAIDTKRERYLLPMEDGSLVTIDMNGSRTGKGRTKVIDQPLHGVCYSDQDLYITSSIDTQTVYVINPKAKGICMDFNCATTFLNPIHVSSGQYDTGDGTKPVIIVSDWSNHCIKLLDYSGNLLYTCGKKGQAGGGDGELYYPLGVCMGSGGRIIVCDCDNNRVVSFYREEDKDRWEVLLDKDELSGQSDLNHVVYDHKHRKLFMLCNFTKINVFKRI